MRPRTQRKLILIRLKNKICAHAPHLGGLFTTHDMVDRASWADIYFLSLKDKRSFYNATVDTCLHAYFARCEELSWKASEKRLPFDSPESDYELFVKEPDGNFTLAPPPQSLVNAERRAFDGSLRSEWIEAETVRIADSGDVWVSPRVELDRSYRYGVGLFAILPDEHLSITALHEFVADFFARREAPYEVSSVRLSFPASRYKEASNINAVFVDPKDWAPLEEAQSLRQAARASMELEILMASRSASLEAPAPLKTRTPHTL